MKIITKDYDEEITLSSQAVRAIGKILNETDVEEGDKLLIHQTRVALIDKNEKLVIEEGY